MRKILTLCIITAMVFACKSKTPVETPASNAPMTKLDKSAQVAMKGNWKISSVSYPGSEYILVKSFNVADSKCFIGSTWVLVSNNNKGYFTLNDSGCPNFASDITWYVNKEGQFVFKILDEGLKSKKVTTGFVLDVANQTENSFQLIDKIQVGNKPTSVVYQFEKVN